MSTFQTNLNTSIVASNNYVPVALKPEIQGGDTCKKIISTKFKDEILQSNTSGNTNNYNMKKIISKRDRPYVWQPPNPLYEIRTKTYTWPRWCWRRSWWGWRSWYRCGSWVYHWRYRHYFPWIQVPDHPRYFCTYEGEKNDNKLNFLGNHLGRQNGIKRGLEKGFKYIVEDNRGSWYGINNNYLFNSNNKWKSDECYRNYKYITNVYEITDKIAQDCADMVNSINKSASSNDMTSALENKLYIDMVRANNMLTPKQSDLPSEEVLESFECSEENEQSNVAPPVKNLVCQMNNQIKTLAQGYDFRARYANNQRNILKNSFTSNEIFEKKIDNNVQKLDNIANEIMVKDRLIKFNKEKLKENDLTEKLLRGFFATFVLLTIPVVLYFTKVISLRVLFALVLAYFIGYFIYMGVMIRKNKLKNFFKPVFKDMSDYEKAARNYVKKEKNRISKELSEFAYGQCNCPPEEEARPELPDAEVPITENEYELDNNDGYYYNDGTAPPQRMVPKVQNLPGDPEKFNIDWEVNREMGVTKSSDGTAPPNWYNIGLPVLSDSMQRILTKCQSHDKEIVVSDNEFIKGIYYLIKKEEPTNQIVNSLKNRFMISRGMLVANMISEEESVQIPNFNLNNVRKSFFDWLLADEKISEKQFMRDLHSKTGDKQADYKNNILISLYVSLLKEKTLTIGL
jgi:hypothetical protein